MLLPQKMKTGAFTYCNFFALLFWGETCKKSVRKFHPFSFVNFTLKDILKIKKISKYT